MGIRGQCESVGKCLVRRSLPVACWFKFSGVGHQGLNACRYVREFGLTLACRRGRLVQDKATKEPKLNCRNWECGVVIPVQAEKGGLRPQDGATHGDAGLETLGKVVPIPMMYPAEGFEGKKPWTYFDST